MLLSTLPTIKCPLELNIIDLKLFMPFEVNYCRKRFVCCLGSGLCLVGATEIVLNAPQMDDTGGVSSVDDLLKALVQPLFVIYALSALSGTALLSLHTAPRHGASNPLVYLGITALVGSLTVCLCKTLSLMLRETFSGTLAFLIVHC